LAGYDTDSLKSTVSEFMCGQVPYRQKPILTPFSRVNMVGHFWTFSYVSRQQFYKLLSKLERNLFKKTIFLYKTALDNW
jgi:hypothetical protein